tara:strand:+ start:686 stop:808 length:123 start_codon:yes stop_codon:yes gene_type:complete
MKFKNKFKKIKTKLKPLPSKKISLFELQNSPKYTGFRVKA